MRTVRSSLRSFFRFLRFEGFCGDALEAALPTVAHWRLATLPRSLTEQQVEQVFASFDAPTPCRQRDQTIVQCLSTLGLRPGEVAGLCLDDIDWRNGTLQLFATPSGTAAGWLAWAARSRLAPFVKLARTVRKHAAGILAYLDTKMTNGPVEGFNNKLRVIARRAYGFHSHGALISMLFLCCGGIELAPPLPTCV